MCVCVCVFVFFFYKNDVILPKSLLVILDETFLKEVYYERRELTPREKSLSSKD